MIGPVHYRGKWGFLSPDGNFIIEPRYEGLGECRQGRICFLSDGKLGILSSSGEIVVPPTFEGRVIPHFTDGLCPMRLHGAVGYLDKVGQWAIKPEFDDGWNVLNGKALAVTGDDDAHYCVIDKSGKQVSRLEVYRIPVFWDWPANWECFPVFVDNNRILLTEWINWRGEVVFARKYCWMTEWSEQVAGFCDHEDRVSNPWGLVHATGEVIAIPQFYWLSSFTFGLAAAGKTEKAFGFINTRGEWAIEPKYRQVVPFSEGLACVTVKGKKGFINALGEMVIEPRFNNQGRFSGGYAQMQYEGRTAVIDKSGRSIWEAKNENE